MLGWMPKILKQILQLKQTVTKWSPSGQQVAVKLWIFSSFSIPNAIPSKYMKTEHISFHFNKLKIPTYHNTTQRLQNT